MDKMFLRSCFGAVAEGQLQFVFYHNGNRIDLVCSNVQECILTTPEKDLHLGMMTFAQYFTERYCHENEYQIAVGVGFNGSTLQVVSWADEENGIQPALLCSVSAENFQYSYHTP